MDVWRLIDLGQAEPLVVQTFYEAVAKAVDEGTSPNTLILVQPSSPYVCVGFHQEMEKEVNIEYCRSNNLPIIRRSQGGGTVYLDSKQIFYQAVASGKSEVIPLSVEKLFEKFLSATVYVYRKLGLQAEYKALNDVIVNGRKISGNGAGKFGEDITILVGNIILDLDYDSMANVLKVPSEKFRDKVAKSMREWVTCLSRELKHIPPVDEIKKLVVEGYEQTLGIRIARSEPTETEYNIWEEEVKPKHSSSDWLFIPDSDQEELVGGRAVKIADGVKVIEVEHKAKKLIKVRAQLIGTRIVDIKISGDFFVVPEGALASLEAILKDAILEREDLLARVQDFYNKSEVETPGMTPEDFVEAILKLRDLAEDYGPAVYPYMPRKEDLD